MRLSDYLDELAVRPGRGFGTVPSIPVPTGAFPLTVTPAATAAASSLLRIYQASDKAAVDAQMWRLDAGWLGAGSWANMRLCVVGRGDVSGGITVSPYGGAGTCRTPTGAPADPTCTWGFWRINRCDLDTAAAAFQYGRYLWAQARMRELLASKPVPGRVNDDVAAAWAWSAAQLISALWWSTNVRFDNPNAATTRGDYVGGLMSAGLFAPAPSSNYGIAYDGAPVSGNPYFLVPYPLNPRAINNLGYTAYTPTKRNDFSPGNGPLRFMDRTAPPPTSTRIYVDGNPFFSNGPFNLGAPELEAIRQRAFAIQTASGDSDALRWASTMAWNQWWFQATWGWPTKWQSLPGVTATQQLYAPGRRITSTQQPVVLGGGVVIVEELARQLAFYSDPAKNYIRWMQSAMQTYSDDTAGLTGPAALDFNRAKNDLLAQINAAASGYEAASRAGTSGGDSTTTAITTLAVSLFQSIILLVAQSIPIFGLLYQALVQIEQLILGWAGGAIGNIPCPAFPFIRVMAPASGGCDISIQAISASLLGLDSAATWPVSINGQTRTFVVDGKTFPVTFGLDTTPDAVANRINSAAALVGLTSVASVRAGQVHLEGRDPGQGPVRATAGTACSLGFPGPCSAPTFTPHLTPTGTRPIGTSKPSSPVPWLVGGALLLRYFLG